MKSNINKLFYTAFVSMILVLNSCTKKIDEAFLNPNAQVKQPIETLLPGIIASMVISNSANGSFYGMQRDDTYIGRFIQNFAQNTTGFRNDQMADYFGTTTPDLCGDVWAMHYYGHGQNISRIIEWGSEEKKWDYVGVAYAIRAWGFLNVADLHSDAIIVKEAFRPEQLTFNYNTQEEAYNEVRSLCRIAIDFLSRTGDKVSQVNLALGDQFMNNGDLNKWKKFVYGVMARSFHRLTNKATYSADSVIKYCDLAMQINTENSNITWSNAGAGGTYSWFSPFRGNIGGLRQGKFIADIMQGINTQFPTNSIDPRAWYILRENANGTFRGVRPNRGGQGLALGDSCQNFWGGSFAVTTASSDAAARYVFKNKAIWPIITASEIQFIKAEALYRKGLKPAALTAYRNGINLHFDQLISTYEESVPVAKRITAASRAAYLANPLVVPASPNDLTLSHIMLQKYISLYIWGIIETWVDMRRFHYTDIDPITLQQVYRDFTLPTGIDLWPANLGKPTYQLRPRYNSEYLYNIASLNKVGAFGGDYITQQPWFSQP